ncbi:hypothetical protein FXO37_31499 [Capsicum annuum]|nr:hypothetical protein FXO37_31499 [Capsicum annuum]
MIRRCIVRLRFKECDIGRYKSQSRSNSLFTNVGPLYYIVHAPVNKVWACGGVLTVPHRKKDGYLVSLYGLERYYPHELAFEVELGPRSILYMNDVSDFFVFDSCLLRNNFPPLFSRILAISEPTSSEYMFCSFHGGKLEKETVISHFIDIQSMGLVPSNLTPFMLAFDTSTSVCAEYLSFVSLVQAESVDNFLQSLGLEKYAITFQAEEVDMAALVHMTDEDLKAMGIPMVWEYNIIVLYGNSFEDCKL